MMGLKSLSTEHYIAIEWLSLPNRGGKTYEEIGVLCGVDRKKLYRWRQDELFNKELKKQIMRNTLDRMPEIMESIPDHIIKGGNAAMLKTFLQAHDMLTEKHEVSNKNDENVLDAAEVKRKIEEYQKKNKSE